MDRLRARIEEVHIRGFRSLADVAIERLPDVTVMIGANGSGKSNVIRFSDMLGWMLGASRLQEFVQRQGGADDQLFGGRGRTPQLEAELHLKTAAGRNDYRFVLAHAHPDRLIFLEEAFRFTRAEWPGQADWQYAGSAHTEAGIVDIARPAPTPHPGQRTASVVVNLLRNCAAFQFHDTSDGSRFKQSWDAYDNRYLRAHGGNLAAILFRLETEDIKRFDLICRHIGRILPGFERFVVEEQYGKISLRWKARNTEKTFGAHLTSDGSLRFFALVTLLNLPPEMLPDVILLDEPELGLHPAAIVLIAEMIRTVSYSRQVIIATQSPLFVDAFGLESVMVLDLCERATRIRRPNPDSYRRWLEQDYSPGAVWKKNIIGGNP